MGLIKGNNVKGTQRDKYLYIKKKKRWIKQSHKRPPSVRYLPENRFLAGRLIRADGKKKRLGVISWGECLGGI